MEILGEDGYGHGLIVNGPVLAAVPMVEEWGIRAGVRWLPSANWVARGAMSGLLIRERSVAKASD